MKVSPFLQGAALLAILGATLAAHAQCPAGYQGFSGKDYATPAAQAAMPAIFKSSPLLLTIDKKLPIPGAPLMQAAVKVTYDGGRLFLTGRAKLPGLAQGLEKEISRVCYNSAGQIVIRLTKAKDETAEKEIPGQATANAISLNGLLPFPIELQQAKNQADYDRMAGLVADTSGTTVAGGRR